VELLPAGAGAVERCRPLYEEHPGWSESTVGVRDFASLPGNAQRYLKRVEELTRVPIAMVSTGAERNDTILIRHPFH
jgi:adenylosuccinate synthase